MEPCIISAFDDAGEELGAEGLTGIHIAPGDTHRIQYRLKVPQFAQVIKRLYVDLER